jgi:aryl-alcohol dehydrogenase-like predicted oxidoreductase
MESVPLGGTGVRVSQVILGCGSIGGVGSARDTWIRYGQSKAEAFEMLEAATELGVTVLDTAVSYAGGESEAVIGRWLANRRSGVVVTTKAGGVVEDGTPQIDLSRDNLLRQLRLSLERLGLSSIDLYMTHAPDEETPIAETLEVLAAFIEQGLVRSIGACNVTVEQLRLALETSDRLGLPRYEWVQNEYSLLARSDEQSVIPLCAERGLGYTPHSPLCGGILSGKYRPGAAAPPDSRLAVRAAPYQEYMADQTLEGVQRVAGEADRRGVSSSGLALAWVMSRPDVTAPVVGPRRLEHLTAVREALELRLDVDEQDHLASLISA